MHKSQDANIQNTKPPQTATTHWIQAAIPIFVVNNLGLSFTCLLCAARLASEEKSIAERHDCQWFAQWANR